MSEVYTTSSNAPSRSTNVTSTSNLDSAALIDAAVQQRKAPADRLEVAIEKESAKAAAYTELQDLTGDISGAIAPLRNPDDGSGDVFETKVAYLSSNNGTDPNSLIGVSVEDGARNGSHDLEVVQTAEAHRVSGNTQASRSTALGLSGSFALGSQAGSAVTIDVAPDMSLDEVAEAINAESATTGVAASVIKVSDASYRLVLSAETTANTISVSDVSGTVMQDLGVTSPDGSFANELQAPRQSVVLVDGIEIRRDTNEIDDAIDGVTFYLYGAAPGTSIGMDVENDHTSIVESIEGFVESYNAYREFVIRNQEVGEGGVVSSEAALFGDPILRNLNQQVSSILTSRHGTSATASLADIGLTFDENNFLVMDQRVVEEALLTDLESVESLFQFQMRSDSNDLRVQRNGNGPAAQSFVLDVEVDAAGDITSASVDGDPSLFTVKGNRLIGAEGTAYDGLVLAFTGNQSTSVDVQISRGIADQLYGCLVDYGNRDDGQIQHAIDSSGTRIDSMERQVSDIERRAADYRQRLTEYYAYLENQIAESNRLKEQLQALFDDDNN